MILWFYDNGWGWQGPLVSIWPNPRSRTQSRGPRAVFMWLLEISKDETPRSLGNLWRRWESKHRSSGVLIGTEVDLKAWTQEVCQNQKVDQILDMGPTSALFKCHLFWSLSSLHHSSPSNPVPKEEGQIALPKYKGPFLLKAIRMHIGCEAGTSAAIKEWSPVFQKGLNNRFPPGMLFSEFP